MRTLIVCLFVWMSCCVQAQSGHAWEAYLNEVMTAEDVGTEAWEDTYDLLCELEQHPIDINQASREQLEQLPFLSAQQVEEIMEYLYRYGPMKSLAELRMIRSLDDSRRRLLTCFVYVDESGMADSRQHDYLHHELMATGRIPFYERKGDADAYQGYPYRHWVKYQLTYGDQLKAGIVGSQDAGEPFFAGKNRLGYDYYSLWLQLNQWGRIETLVLGNYRGSWQGVDAAKHGSLHEYPPCPLLPFLRRLSARGWRYCQNRQRTDGNGLLLLSGDGCDTQQGRVRLDYPYLWLSSYGNGTREEKQPEEYDLWRKRALPGQRLPSGCEFGDNPPEP